MNDEAIQKIISYANEYLFEPRSNWSKQAIMERSYERWAVDEILLTIMDHPLTEADFVIEGFILKMEFFFIASCESLNWTSHVHQPVGAGHRANIPGFLKN